MMSAEPRGTTPLYAAWNQIKGILGGKRPFVERVLPKERRCAKRYADGAPTDIDVKNGQSPSRGRILDVSSRGIRLWSETRLQPGQRVSCRVDFVSRSVWLGTRVMWEKSADNGYIYGVQYVPVIPGTEGLLDNYMMRVLRRNWDARRSPTI